MPELSQERISDASISILLIDARRKGPRSFQQPATVLASRRPRRIIRAVPSDVMRTSVSSSGGEAVVIQWFLRFAIGPARLRRKLPVDRGRGGRGFGRR